MVVYLGVLLRLSADLDWDWVPGSDFLHGCHQEAIYLSRGNKSKFSFWSPFCPLCTLEDFFLDCATGTRCSHHHLLSVAILSRCVATVSGCSCHFADSHDCAWVLLSRCAACWHCVSLYTGMQFPVASSDLRIMDVPHSALMIVIHLTFMFLVMWYRPWKSTLEEFNHLLNASFAIIQTVILLMMVIEVFLQLGYSILDVLVSLPSSKEKLKFFRIVLHSSEVAVFFMVCTRGWRLHRHLLSGQTKAVACILLAFRCIVCKCTYICVYTSLWTYL